MEKTPHEMWTDKRPSLSFLKIWGWEAFVKRLLSDKLSAKSDKCYFVGYPRETLGYYFYNREEGKVFVARNGVFLEKEFLGKEDSGSRVRLEEIREESTGSDSARPIVDPDSTTQSTGSESARPTADPELATAPGPRRSERLRSGRNVLLLDSDEPAT